jgi:hypothetical protein
MSIPDTALAPSKPTDCGCGCCDQQFDVVTYAAGAWGNPPWNVSKAGIRYADGAVVVAVEDLKSRGFSIPWGHYRAWSNLEPYTDGLNLNGDGWVASTLPQLIQDSSTTAVVLLSNGINARYFDPDGVGGFTPRFFDQTTLVTTTFPPTSKDALAIDDTAGNRIYFTQIANYPAGNSDGQFLGIADPAGNFLAVTGYDDDGRITTVERSITVDEVTYTETYVYEYLPSTDPNAGLLASVTLQRTDDKGTKVVRAVLYTYYTDSDTHGQAGDLQTAVVQDADDNVIDTTYYRYWISTGSGGVPHGLKYAFGPASFGRLAGAVSDPLTATDTEVAPFADRYFEYDSGRRVTSVTAQGGCSAGRGGLGTSTYAYTASSNTPGVNSWAMKTVETLPDGNSNIVYTNAYAEVMLAIFHQASTSNNWITFNKYDSDGRLLWMAHPSAATGYNDTYADLLHFTSGSYQYLRTDAGLIESITYATSTTATTSAAGDVAGYQSGTALLQGQSGDPVPQSAQDYILRTVDSRTVSPIATATAYRNDDGTGDQTTSYAYSWYTDTLQMQSVTTTWPAVSTDQNGPGDSDVTRTFFDIYGRPIWGMDGAGFITYTAYDPASGGVTKSIVDVDTDDEDEFTDKPAGWTTPDDGGLNLITLLEVDGLARPTMVTRPGGGVDYTVYNDPGHEVRVYPSWDPTLFSDSGGPTGPTRVQREDRQLEYSEALTMSAQPDVDGGRPTAMEAVSDVQSLARTLVNDAGQVIHQDAYFDLTGVSYSASSATLGTEGTNYYRTTLAYDTMGRTKRVLSPTGTITRSIYDAPGRLSATWIGTNDTPGSGNWSPTNNTSPANMTQVSATEYDGGGIGDGNPTLTTNYPNDSTPDRVAQVWYDWRDRAMVIKQGVQGTETDAIHRPLVYTEFDNLGQAISTERYDGDGVTITYTDGVPDRPDGTLLRAMSTAEFDDRGRVFRGHTWVLTRPMAPCPKTVCTPTPGMIAAAKPWPWPSRAGCGPRRPSTGQAARPSSI